MSNFMRSTERHSRPRDDDNLLKWLEDQPSQLQTQLAQEIILELLDRLSSTTLVSSESCNKLLHLIEQCKGSKSRNIQNSAFSVETCTKIFKFFIEFNEKNQNRCMRRALELVSKLVASNPDRTVANKIKKDILDRCLFIVGHRSSRQLIKPSLRTLEHLLGKGTISIHELIKSFAEICLNRNINLSAEIDIHDNTWNSLISEIFEWMSLPEVSQTAGKLLVTILRQVRKNIQNTDQNETQFTSWQVWLQINLERKPDLLESIKNYLLPSLFSLDRYGSLGFLESLNTKFVDSQPRGKLAETQIVLRLAAFEVGKKTGLIEEEALITFQRPLKRSLDAVVINESLIYPLLTHSSGIIRSLSFSVLVSSLSPLRPLSSSTIWAIKSNLHILHFDSDVKFRNEILSTLKQLIERLRGSTAFLVKELYSIKLQLQNESCDDVSQENQARTLLQQILDLLQEQRLFVKWFFEFLIGELIPTASYQRHVTSLKAINLWLSSGIVEATVHKTRAKLANNETHWPFQIDFFSPEAIRILLDLLVDPFEDVRALASSILKMSSPAHFMKVKDGPSAKRQDPSFISIPEVCDWSSGSQPVNLKCDYKNFDRDVGAPLSILEDFIKYVEVISNKTGRADYADGLARSYELLNYLLSSGEDKIRVLTRLVDIMSAKVLIAEENLAIAVHDAPLHGILAALSYTWENMEIDSLVQDNCLNKSSWLQKFQRTSVQICLRIWKIAKPILCNDSPEGHLPEDVEDSNEIDTKDVLSYSFRAIHESSNLQRTLMRKSQNSIIDAARLPDSVFKSIGDLSLEQLSCLRHRGAFSTVSATFAVCCKLNAQYQSNFLNTWLESAFSCLHTQVSTTRRSAGIPSIITAIIAVLPKSEFEKTINKLLQITRNEINSNVDQEQLPQVHALNSLKEIVKSVTTSSKVDAHISACLEVVGQCLNSPAWAIRNSALILLRSLIDNLVGTSGKITDFESGWDGMSVKIQYEKFPALPRIILQLLQGEEGDLFSKDSENHTVLPALSIIRRAGSPPEYRDHFRRLLCKLLGSKTWHLRDQAARTFMVLLEKGTVFETLRNLIENPGKVVNEQHGSILTAKLILLERINITMCELSKLNDLYGLILDSQYRTCNPFVQNEFAELANATLMLILAHPDLKDEHQRRELILRLSKDTRPLFGFDSLYKDEPSTVSEFSSQFSVYFRGHLRQKLLSVTILNDESAIVSVMRQAQDLGSDLFMSILDSVLPIFEFNTSEEAFRGTVRVLTKVVEKTEDTELICKILDIIPKIFRIFGITFQSDNKLIRKLFQKLEKLVALGPKTPKLLNSYYAFSGLIFSHKLRFPSGSDNRELNAISNWIQGLRKASQVHQEFELRYAVMVAIQTFYKFCPSGNERPDLRGEYSELNFVLMTLLVDDDEEIRRLAASTVSDQENYSLTPSAALDIIFKLQIARGCLNEKLGWHCIQNILVLDKSQSVYDPVDADTLLQSASTHDYSLFAVEEPNLFCDPCLTLDYYSDAFLHVPFISETQLQLYNSGLRSEFSILIEWSSAGFRALQRRYPPAQDMILRNITENEYCTSVALVFLTIHRVIICGRTVRTYWQKNSEPIHNLKKSTVEGNKLVDSWAAHLDIINHGLDLISSQIDIHPSLRRIAVEKI
ncbi:tRNA -methyltransferase non-catalytic subunit TRM732 [Golovinomyces cichoracearum]|uniref:tRNA-methyltransferase non-catalytic subunit TRM732 n=1 Tax=Golovinomyces cichoracearum TaxID=62708 RepID=A0A420HPR4_9PEZI|nr:tRNA -methyltransferase non-catalytic subunit TRM732 [Golovinomyces cichoracearum]